MAGASPACGPTRRMAPLDVHADLVVGCDGRHSTVRERAGLQVEDLGAPMDVLWFRLPKKPGDPAEIHGPVRMPGASSF